MKRSFDEECKDNPYKSKEKRLKSKYLTTAELFSQENVIDFESASTWVNCHRHSGIVLGTERDIFTLSDHPGLFIIRSALPHSLQLELCHKCLSIYANAPNNVNDKEVMFLIYYVSGSMHNFRAFITHTDVRVLGGRESTV